MKKIVIASIAALFIPAAAFAQSAQTVSSVTEKLAEVSTAAPAGAPADTLTNAQTAEPAHTGAGTPGKVESRIDAIASSIAGSNGSKGSAVSLNLWNGDYEKSNWEVIVGYVNKSWRCTYEYKDTTISMREDMFGDPDDKYLHGFQIGGLYTPSFDWGLGLRTGLFFEFYTSRSKWIKPWCNHFSEADMYIPVHASFRLPVAQQAAFNIFGGIGFQWAMAGSYYKVSSISSGWWWRRPRIAYQEVAKQVYGNGWPKRVNWQAECGANFRYKCVTLSFTYSFGIVEQGIQNSFDEGQSWVTAVKSRQDKMQATISFTF